METFKSEIILFFTFLLHTWINYILSIYNKIAWYTLYTYIIKDLWNSNFQQFNKRQNLNNVECEILWECKEDVKKKPVKPYNQHHGAHRQVRQHIINATDCN